jgi:hypothetical protein
MVRGTRARPCHTADGRTARLGSDRQEAASPRPPRRGVVGAVGGRDEDSAFRAAALAEIMLASRRTPRCGPSCWADTRRGCRRSGSARRRIRPRRARCCSLSQRRVFWLGRGREDALPGRLSGARPPSATETAGRLVEACAPRARHSLARDRRTRGAFATSARAADRCVHGRVLELADAALRSTPGRDVTFPPRVLA